MTRRATPELPAGRLVLRAFTLADAPDFHAAYGDAASMRHWNHAPSPNVARTERYLANWMKPAPDGWMVWAVALRETGRCIGMVNFHGRDVASRRAEIGYILTPDASGQGHAQEAVGAMIAHMQAALNVHRIEAQIEPENRRSCALVERLGFTLEAPLMRDRWKIGGEFRSVSLYALVGGRPK